MKELNNSTRDIARELARKFSTMTHDELDILESVLVPMKFAKATFANMCITWNVALHASSILRMARS